MLSTIRVQFFCILIKLLEYWCIMRMSHFHSINGRSRNAIQMHQHYTHIPAHRIYSTSCKTCKIARHNSTLTPIANFDNNLMASEIEYLRYATVSGLKICSTFVRWDSRDEIRRCAALCCALIRACANSPGSDARLLDFPSGGGVWNSANPSQITAIFERTVGTLRGTTTLQIIQSTV